MPPSRLLKYLLDIEAVIKELEDVVQIHNSDFKSFQQNFMAVRTAERGLEIIGEVVNKIQHQFPDITISEAQNIVGVRNLIAHAYDTIDPRVLWGILVNDIPVLKKEITAIKTSR